MLRLPQNGALQPFFLRCSVCGTLWDALPTTYLPAYSTTAYLRRLLLPGGFNILRLTCHATAIPIITCGIAAPPTSTPTTFYTSTPLFSMGSCCGLLAGNAMGDLISRGRHAAGRILVLRTACRAARTACTGACHTAEGGRRANHLSLRGLPHHTPPQSAAVPCTALSPAVCSHFGTRRNI